MPFFSLLVFFIVAGCNFQKNNTEPSEAETSQKYSGPEIIAELDRLKFFNHTDAADLPEVKAAFQNSYTDLNFFQGKLRKESLEFMDNRYYLVDCEELFEAGGLTKYLKLVKPVFHRLELQLEFENEQSVQNQHSWMHTINLNGQKYVAFSGQFSDLDWAIAYVNFIEMLNAELKEQGSEERFYPITCGNDGAMVLLTPQQFEFVRVHYPWDNEHPVSIKTWKAQNGL